MNALDITLKHRGHRYFDEELWDFCESALQPRLVNLSNAELLERQRQIEKNICFLEPTPTSRANLSPDRGWISPFYWFRLRHWTLNEIQRRGLAAPLPAEHSSPTHLRSQLHGTMIGGQKILTRISRIGWLEDTLNLGRIRLRRASSYKLIEGDAARTDNELMRTTRIPGSLVTITKEDGSPLSILGDLHRNQSRQNSGDLPQMDYWLTSFSTDLDPRLIYDFQSAEGDDAILVIFDVMGFLKRLLPPLNSVGPMCKKALEQIDYHDQFYPTGNHTAVRSTKDMRFAYQREWRLAVDPQGQLEPTTEEAFFVDAGSLVDIAAIYHPDGQKLEGAGPDFFTEA